MISLTIFAAAASAAAQTAPVAEPVNVRRRQMAGSTLVEFKATERRKPDQ